MNFQIKESLDLKKSLQADFIKEIQKQKNKSYRYK
jgi:hypothetical protein